MGGIMDFVQANVMVSGYLAINVVTNIPIGMVAHPRGHVLCAAKCICRGNQIRKHVVKNVGQFYDLVLGQTSEFEKKDIV